MDRRRVSTIPACSQRIPCVVKQNADPNRYPAKDGSEYGAAVNDARNDVQDPQKLQPA
jgi:hypothetical protein